MKRCDFQGAIDGGADAYAPAAARGVTAAKWRIQ
jgi:hypothetical protein